MPKRETIINNSRRIGSARRVPVYTFPGVIAEGMTLLDPDLLWELETAQQRFAVNVLRPRDLLMLKFTFINFIYVKHADDAVGVLKRWKPFKAAYIIVQFPQQSIQEKAFFEVDPNVDFEQYPPLPGTYAEPASEDPTAATPPIPARLSGRSRVVLKMPADAEPIPFTIEGLLDVLSKYPMMVAKNARPPEPGSSKMKIEKSKFKEGAISGEALAGMEVRANKLKDLAVKSDSAIAISHAVWRSKRLNAAGAAAGMLKEVAGENATVLERIRSLIEHVGYLVLNPKPEVPEELETAIEAPVRLILSPNTYGAWKHANKEVTAVRRVMYSVFPSGKMYFKEFKLIPKLEIDGLAKKIKTVEQFSLVAGSEKPQAAEKAEVIQLIETAKTAARLPFKTDEFKLLFEDIDWVELWHTRLATRQSNGEVTEATDPKRTVRAIWARDARFSNVIDEATMPDPYPATPLSPDDPYRTALDSLDRFNIVHLSSNYQLKVGSFAAKDTTPYIPLPINIERMMLSTLGSWLNLRGAWPILPKHLAVEEWRHRSSMARDHYVRVVYRGYLFPFGHRASLIKVTERKFHHGLPGNPAYQRQRMFIVVREPERSYGGTEIRDSEKQYDLQFPFVNVRITTLVTPSLEKPEDSDIGGKSRQLFRPRVNDQDFRFHVIAKDVDGNDIEFSTPMNFVGKEILEAGNCIDLINQTQVDFTTGSAKNSAAAAAELEGQAVSFASSLKQGDTWLNCDQMWFGAWVPDAAQFNKLKQTMGAIDIARFYPRIEKASARIPAIQNLAGDNSLTTFKYPDAYLKHGFLEAGNKGQVFAELINTSPLSFSNQGQRSGALLTPDMTINGLSRVLGPVGGEAGALDTISGGSFDPEKFFKGMSPMLFGVIPLWELVGPIVDCIAGKDAVPKFMSQTLSPLENMLSDFNLIYEQLERWGSLSAGDLMNALTSAINSIADILSSLSSSVPESKWTALTNALKDIHSFVSDVLEALNDPSVSASVRIPLEEPLRKLGTSLTTAELVVENFLKPAITLFTEKRFCIDWKPKLEDWPSGSAVGYIFDTRGGEACLHLNVSAAMVTNEKGLPYMSVSCGLEKFNLNLIGKDNIASFMYLKFDKIEFVYVLGKKADVNVEFDGIEFVGVLSFVEALKSLIPLDGFSDPPGLEITAEGITGSLSLALPNIAFGVFSMTNMSLNAGFSVPFIGEPLSVWFGFCSRDNPFCLTVSMFGGGGFFAITLQPNGLKCLEASFEFGASISVDFGVASGGIYAMAGIYFKMETVDGELAAQLTGYFRMGGYLSVLGIISISIELYLSLTYEFSSGKCTGKAELTLEVEVLFFSVSVTVTAERKFAGSNGDPTFAELMAPYNDPLDGSVVNPWEVYCEAFA